jgi:hypothetical protein
LSWSHNLYSFTIASLVTNLSISTDKVIIQHPFTFFFFEHFFGKITCYTNCGLWLLSTSFSNALL